ncbi:MAG: acylphosphatase [Oricola sp.]|jgi:acylphosphatase|nr:acylphosphatase [Oricola sp.]
MSEKAVRALISGRVQGVSFRAWTQDAARARGLRGWVRNLADGRVEALFAGPSEKVDAMLAACAEGPPAARVSDVQHDAVDPVPDVRGFEIRRP